MIRRPPFLSTLENSSLSGAKMQTTVSIKLSGKGIAPTLATANSADLHFLAAYFSASLEISIPQTNWFNDFNT